MGRRFDVDHLVGSAEIAQRLELRSPQRVRELAREYDDFPQPVLVLVMGNVWNWSDVKRWAKAHDRLPTSV